MITLIELTFSLRANSIRAEFLLRAQSTKSPLIWHQFMNHTQPILQRSESLEDKTVQSAAGPATGMNAFLRRNVAVPAALCLVSLAASGCVSFGPKVVRSARSEYNKAFATTSDEELLLNMVRLKYRDTTYFVNIDRVTSSSSFDLGTSVSGSPVRRHNTSAGEGGGNAGLRLMGFGINGSASYSESPTVFYTPMEGSVFARQMMSRLNFDVILLLANSGWSIERLLLITTQEMNGLKNAPTASGPTPSKEPEFREFREALKHLRALQVKGQVALGKAAGDEDALELRLIDAEKDADAKAFKKLLGLAPESNSFSIKAGMGRGVGDTIFMITRPLISTMNYLSQAVVSPKDDLSSGKLTQTVKSSGQPFDWQEIFNGILKIESSVVPIPPQNAAVSAQYRGRWFYIPDNDLDSKSTFSLLTQIMALQSGKAGAKEAPISFSIGK